MKFLLKIVISATISGIILAMNMGNKNNGMLAGLATIPQVIKSGFNAIQNKEPTLINRICEIKKNGDEECRNLPSE